jgi:succinate dehydrogenase / fumarate reductase cytochrome b subunit
MSKSALLSSSLAKKYWMALTGLFLCLFLVIHLAGNTPLLWGDQEGFNEYSKFMTTFAPIKIVSYLLYAGIVFHSIDGILLTIQNRNARPQKYAKNKPSANSSWASRNMAFLGIILLAFIIIHMRSFWFEYKFGVVPEVDGLKDLYTITVTAFEQWWYTLLYVVSMLAMGFHLSHGFQSSFQSLGLSHPKYTPLIKKVGMAYAIIISLGFASIPAYIYINSVL